MILHRVFHFDSEISSKKRFGCFTLIGFTFAIILATAVIKFRYKPNHDISETSIPSGSNSFTILNYETAITMMTGIATDSQEFTDDATIQNQILPTSSTIINTTNNKSETTPSIKSYYWTQDASLSKGRSAFGAVLLANETIMAAGGLENTTALTRTCELYSSSIGWTAGTQMKNFRYYFTLAAFANNTKALATGTLYTPQQQTAEVYDTIKNTWTLTSTNMSTGRYLHTATLLQNGSILIIGGKNSSSTILSDVDIFMPSSNSFSKVNSMNMGRYVFTSTLLNDGFTVFVTGGTSTNKQMTSTAELYVSGSWIFTNTNMTQLRAYHSAVLLPNGNVLIAGGGDGGTTSYSTAEIYNPTTRTFKSTASMKYRRGSFTLTLLPSGNVLATGGADWTTKTFPTMCELYDPISQTWSNTSSLNYGRSLHNTILLNDSVLIMGGSNGQINSLTSSEKYYL
ncbi:unnamed protein product [Adineta steineri]|uniref:Attractin/MKLN-like beta-propeller domain-containing protein n=1 Tax=Adineta steineri TaxID=433720 RepID=A0A813NKB9_9BILA|nr:unnamed protein product [Adineta steineri]CAF3632101.1 unnamed protein product [Adineta steineri]